jgi:site-specific DNA-methyltransferase (adenine-specific)
VNEKIRLYHADAYERLDDIDTGSVDAVITDPPYGTTQMEWDTAAQWGRLWPLIKDVLKDAGVVVSFSAPPYHVDLIQSNRAWWRYEIVWRKTMGTRYLDSNDRPLQGHENIQVFTPKMRESTYNPQKWDSGQPYNFDHGGRDREHYNDFDSAVERSSSGERHPLTVIQFKNGDNQNNPHPSWKPVGLMRWLVRTYTNEGERVLDPFCGAGSTGVAALREGRTFTGIEMNDEYVEKARARCAAEASAPSMFQG